MLNSKLHSFVSSTAITLNEFYFALSTFQISGKQKLIHDHDGHVRLGLNINKKPLRHYFLRHWILDGAGRIMLSCGHLVKSVPINKDLSQPLRAKGVRISETKQDRGNFPD